MAHMYPDSLRDDDFKSRAEEKVYNALRDQLDDEWEAFHSTSWTVREGERGSWDGEIDFVVCHPDEGILCIEAKGGAVKFDRGRWCRKDHGEWVPYEKDPFEQAVANTHTLRKLVKQRPGWGNRKPLIGHAVSMP